jgi:hypothetical protein
MNCNKKVCNLKIRDLNMIWNIIRILEMNEQFIVGDRLISIIKILNRYE